MNILNEAEKIINSPLAQRVISSIGKPQVAPSPAVVGVQNPAQVAPNYKPLVIGLGLLGALGLGLVLVLKK